MIANYQVFLGMDFKNAAIKAGLSESYANGRAYHCILRDTRYSAIIDKLKTERDEQIKNQGEITRDQVLADLGWAMSEAKRKGNLNAYIRACELRGKALALFVDRSVTEDVTDVPDLDPGEQRALRAFVQSRLGLVNGQDVTQAMLEGQVTDVVTVAGQGQGSGDVTDIVTGQGSGDVTDIVTGQGQDRGAA